MNDHLLPRKPVFVMDNCPQHKFTEHQIVFMSYNPRTHKVQFYFFCSQCYKELGDDCDAWSVIVSVKDWERMIILDDDQTATN